MPARLVVARHVDDRTLGPPDHRCAQPRHTGPNVAGEDQHIGVSAVRRPPAALKVQVAENLKAHTASMADANGRARVPKRRVTLASPRTAVARGRARLPTGTDEARASDRSVGTLPLRARSGHLLGCPPAHPSVVSATEDSPGRSTWMAAAGG